ncbi:hypothetical protein [Rickettsiella grylli]|uniref:Uncharacterized protein n=1 Tax=Rickettsiella grylli TaxID=59196 RepID=A8PKB3_9COXI|nr:hypothetical protein [Rickettsiella grylli]EDP46558.1 hypothetical protein RICGR_0289 [Rickettsiella grylli]
MSNKILELAFLRNQLASHKFSENDAELLLQIEKKIDIENTIFKAVAINAIKNCKSDIENKNFESATQELQLIHNFCFGSPEIWNSDYFYTVELLSYLEKINDAKRIKKTISLLGDLATKS